MAGHRGRHAGRPATRQLTRTAAAPSATGVAEYSGWGGGGTRRGYMTVAAFRRRRIETTRRGRRPTKQRENCSAPRPGPERVTNTTPLDARNQTITQAVGDASRDVSSSLTLSDCETMAGGVTCITFRARGFEGSKTSPRPPAQHGDHTSGTSGFSLRFAREHAAQGQLTMMASTQACRSTGWRSSISATCP